MFISLNKKIFYALFSLLVFVALFFLMIFLQVYGEKYEDTQKSEILRNRYMIELLHENIQLRREINTLTEMGQSEVFLRQKEEELHRQQQINRQLQENYNQRWDAFVMGGKIIGLSSFLSLFLIIILGFFLQKWVVVPIQRLMRVSHLVSNGDYTRRVDLNTNRRSVDELDTLSRTFNTMLDNIEQNIAGIKNTERFLQSLLDAIPDGIRVIDRSHNIVMVNRAYIKQTKDKNLKKCFDIYNYEYPCPHGVMACPLREIKSCNSKSVNMIHNLGGHPLAINAAPLKIQRAGQEEDFYIVEIMRDLSEDVKFSHEQKIASLGFLATSVAHEMKNNLGAVRMILENLLDPEQTEIISDPEKNKYLNMVYKQIVSSIEMPERLLRLARNNMEETEIIDVNEAVKEVLSLLDYEAKRNGVSIVHEKDASKINIDGNAADFKMIILNLAQNAFKAMTNGGQFSINVSKDKNIVTIVVKDNGIGIPAEKINHIFEPFYSDGHRIRGKGTGLGLAIVKNIVEKLKGTINVSSIVNKGTTFEIKIPKSKRNNLHS